MLARTGLIDQDTGAAWPEPLELLAAPADFLPPRRDAGQPWGTATRLVPPAFVDAVLTVAGHDHLVASVGAGCVAPEELYDRPVSREVIDALTGVQVTTSTDRPIGF